MTPFDRKEYGERGIIVLSPVDGDGAIALRNGRTRFAVVGETLANGDDLRPTWEGIRISDRAMDLIINPARSCTHAAFRALNHRAGLSAAKDRIC